MKTYADLTDAQLIELHCLLWNHDQKPLPNFDREDKPDKVIIDRFEYSTEFFIESGEVLLRDECFEELFHVSNLWQFVARCRAMGLTYEQTQP